MHNDTTTKTMNLPIEFRLRAAQLVRLDGSGSHWVGEAILCGRPLAYLFEYEAASTKVNAIRALQIKIRERCGESA